MSLLLKISNRIYWFYKIKRRFLFRKNTINIAKEGKCKIGKNVQIYNSNIYIASDSELIIADNCKLNNVNLVLKGTCVFGKNNSIESENSNSKLRFTINGVFTLGMNNQLQTSIWQRFNSSLKIGDYNVINFSSQIRCDEKISIGDFNQISYNVMIWDTNTHNIYKAEKRRELTKTKSSGFEYEKPKTNPVVIGSDNWIGKSVVILKGTQINDKCVVAYGTILSNDKILSGTTVMQKYELIKMQNNI